MVGPLFLLFACIMLLVLGPMILKLHVGRCLSEFSDDDANRHSRASRFSVAQGQGTIPDKIVVDSDQRV